MRKTYLPLSDEAVSYTHLDVYKRQVLSLWKIKLYMILPTVSTNYTGAKAMPQR